MKLKSLAAAAMFVAMAAPAMAVEASAPTTPQDDIECAAWASYTGSFAEDDAENDSLAMAFSYFVGRYQAVAGEEFGDALTAALNAMDSDPTLYERYNAACGPRWQAHGEALGAWAASVGGTVVDDGSAS